MYISCKGNVLQQIHETEWQCRMLSKGMSKPEYWVWLKTVTTEDDNGVKSYDFSGEDYEIIETDAPLSFTETIDGREVEKSFYETGYIHISRVSGTHYHLKYVDGKIVKDDDSLKDCKDNAMWATVRKTRNMKLEETDYLALQDQPAMTNDMKVHRQNLRDITTQSDPYNITWPAK